VTRHTISEAKRALHVLVAEDNFVNSTIVTSLLGKRGHTTVAVVNGREAVDAVRSGKFDLVLMDVQMPEMDGHEATRAIRAEEEKTGTHVPIIALTAHAMSGDREACIAAGADNYLSKPITPKDLFAMMESIVAPVTDIESAA
jgi:CheY-like chemotaxis protein